jgi:hypothetical protein
MTISALDAAMPLFHWTWQPARRKLCPGDRELVAHLDSVGSAARSVLRLQ